MEQITNKQEQVFNMLINEGLTQAQISRRLKKSRPMIFKYVKVLIKKGYLKRPEKRGKFKGGVVTPKRVAKQVNKWTYHALEFEINPYYFTDRYYTTLKERGGKSVFLGAWRYSMYYKKIILWLSSGNDYKHKDRISAIMWANKELVKVLEFIGKAEGFHLFKPGYHGVKLLKHHLAFRNAPEHDIVTEKNMFVQFRGNDGKVFLQYDRSNGFKDREYVHREKAIHHSDILEHYLTDLIENSPLTNSQLHSRLSDVVIAFEKQMLFNRQIMEIVYNLMER